MNFMSVRSWNEIVAFYEDFKKEEGWEFLAEVEALVRRIIQNRDTSGIYPFTSHETLCLTRYQTYPEWYDKPLISINSTRTGKFKFELTEPLEDNEVYRQKSEAIVCSPDKALEVYDELVAKLRRLEP
jgi:hypothetical protein